MTEIWSASAGPDDAPHITLIHGSLDRAAGLLKLSRRLSGRYRVTRYDRRGYGRSFPSDGPFGIDEQVADLSALLAAESGRVRPSVLVGHSYGGNVALALAQHRPDLVDGVVTYETPLSWRDWWPGESAGGDAVAWRSDPAEASERFMRRLIGDERWERLPASTKRSRRAEGPAMVGELLDLRARPAWLPERISVPVLAMYGEHGRPYHRRAAETIASELADAELAMLAGARHPGPNTHPDDVAEMVHAFVEARVRPTTTA
ncbi:MAG: alpha/beta hydrolase [Ilumatobacteraceae bacterium]|nr:alpha/beta hydrolase [Ilumatobacteraceae bacterium]